MPSPTEESRPQQQQQQPQQPEMSSSPPVTSAAVVASSSGAQHSLAVRSNFSLLQMPKVEPFSDSSGLLHHLQTTTATATSSSSPSSSSSSQQQQQQQQQHLMNSSSNSLNSWLHSPIGLEEETDQSVFTPSTVDVDAIKRSPTHILPDSQQQHDVGSATIRHSSSKTPLVTIPENWDSINVNAKMSKLATASSAATSSSARSHTGASTATANEDSSDSSSNSSCSDDDDDDSSGSEYSGSTSSTCSSDNSDDSSSSSCCSDQSCTKRKTTGYRSRSPNQFKASKSVIRSKVSNNSSNNSNNIENRLIPNAEVKTEAEGINESSSSNNINSRFLVERSRSSGSGSSASSSSRGYQVAVAAATATKSVTFKVEVPSSQAEIGASKRKDINFSKPLAVAPPRGATTAATATTTVKQLVKLRGKCSSNSVDKSRLLVVKKSDVTGRRIFKERKGGTDKPGQHISGSSYLSVSAVGGHHLQKLGSGGGDGGGREKGNSGYSTLAPEQLGLNGKDSNALLTVQMPEIPDEDLVAFLKDVADEEVKTSSEDDDSSESDSQQHHQQQHQQQQQHSYQLYQQPQQQHCLPPTQVLLQQQHFAESPSVSEAISGRKWVSAAAAALPSPAAAAATTSRVYQAVMVTMPVAAAAAPILTKTSSSRQLEKRKKIRSKNSATTTGLLLQQQHFRQQQQQLCNTQSSDMDHLYINCAASNVSPDSGIQSEGVASSSPMHLGGDLQQQPMLQQANGIVINHPTVIQGHQGFHPAFHGSYSAAAQQQQQQQQYMWGPMQQQQQQLPSPGNYYGQFLPQQQQQPHYNMMSAAAAASSSTSAYQYHNGSASMALINSGGQSKFIMQQQQQQQHLPHIQMHHHSMQQQTTTATQFAPSLNHNRTVDNDGDTPPPVLVPMSTSSTNTNNISPGSSHSSSSSSKDVKSVSVPSAAVSSSRGRGRPKGSKNKVKKVTMECGSQTEESVLLDVRYNNSTDSDTSGASLPPPSLPKFTGGLRSQKEASSKSISCGSGSSRGVGRPPKNSGPPTLEPQIVSSSTSSAFSSRFYKYMPERFKPTSNRQQQYFKGKECEVIVLDSEDEDDNLNEASSDEEEEVVVAKPVKSKKEKKEKKKRGKKRSKSPKIPPVVQKLPLYNKSVVQRHSVETTVKKTSSSSNTVSFNNQRSVTPKSERDSSHSPARNSPVGGNSNNSRPRVSRQDAFLADKQQQQQQQQQPQKQSTFSFTNGEIVPVFDKRYRTEHQPEQRFWRSPASSTAAASRSVSRSSNINLEENPSVASAAAAKQRSSSAESSRVLTKASLKDMSSFQLRTNTGASTKTMLSALAEASMKAKPGRKKRGRRWGSKGANKDASPAGSSCHSSKSPFSPRTNNTREYKYSETLEYKTGKKPKSWKSKHKNVLDPVFLEKMIHLEKDMASCEIEDSNSKPSTNVWPERGPDSVPSIFRKWKIVVPVAGKQPLLLKQDKKKRGKRASKDEREAEVAAAATAAKVNSSEQRLPLKKRHHHQIPKQQQQQQQRDVVVEEEEEDDFETAAVSQRGKSNTATYAATAAASRSSKPSSSLQNAEMQNKSRKQQKAAAAADISIIHEKLSAAKRPTPADRIVEKLGIQNLLQQQRRKSRSGSREKSALRMLEENSERILGGTKYKATKASSSTSMANHSPSKPLPPLASANAAGENFVNSLVDTIDKYTGNNSSSKSNSKVVRANLSEPLSIETSITSSSNREKTTPKSPRKRHLMEMQQEQQKQREESLFYHQNKQPPSLVKVMSTTTTTTANVSPRDPPTRKPEESQNNEPPLQPIRISLSPPKTSPPRLSPPHISPKAVEEEDNSPMHSPALMDMSDDDADMAAAAATATATANRWSVTSSTSSEDEKKSKKKRGRKRKKPIAATKYSDISDDDHSSGGSLKIRLKREKPINNDDLFTRLQNSASTKPVKLTPFLAPLEEEEEERQPLSSPPLRPSSKMSDDDNSPLRKSGRKRKEKKKLTDRQKALVAAKETPSCSSNSNGFFFVADLESEIAPLVVKAPRRVSSTSGDDVITPKIVKATSYSDSGSDYSSCSAEGARLKKCTVRVQKLTEQEIIESSPSPPNFFDHHIGSPPEAKRRQRNRSSGIVDITPVSTALETTTTTTTINTDASKSRIVKKRRRRSNRTGFPAAKKKRRPQSTESPSSSRASSTASAGPRRKILPETTTPIAKERLRKIKQPKPLDVLSQAICQIRSEGEEVVVKVVTEMKRPRGRPPKKRITANTSVNAAILPPPPLPPPFNDDCNSNNSRDGSLTNSIQGSDDLVPMNPGVPIPLMRNDTEEEDYCNSSKRSSRLYEDIDDEIDCLSILPPIGMESGQSSEAPSGTEMDDTSRSSSQSRKTKKSTLFKKTTLKAGLFSNHYKEDNSGGEPKKATTQYFPEEHPHGLLPPPYYCGRQLRQKREDFQLPFDLWWLHAHKQLPGRDVAATWNYKKIKNNVYYDIKPLAQLEREACHCKDDGCCGEDCINRMTYAECDVRLCPLGERCTNNAIQKHRSVQGIERFMTESKGWGIKTKQGIAEGEFIMEYVGEVVSEKVFKHRMSHQYAEDAHHYCLHLDGGMVIDGHRMGGECRFVNHACEPNCEIQKWTVNGLYRMALFSKKEIKPGEELTYDYNFSLFNPHEGQSCHCGSDKCRGVIGGRSQRIKSEDNDNRSSNSRKKNLKSVFKLKRAAAAAAAEFGGTAPMFAPMKQLSNQQQNMVRERHCFLLRNLEKVRQVRESMQRKASGHMEEAAAAAAAAAAGGSRRPEEMILTGLTALATARSMQTRRLAIAQDDPNVTKVVKLAQLLREIFAQVTTIGDENGLSLSRFFNSLPSKKKHPQYHLLISEPIDLNTIDRNIGTGSYTQPDQFDRDFLRLCQNNLRYYGHHSKEGSAAATIRKTYNQIKSEYHAVLEEIVGSVGAMCFKKSEEDNNADGNGGDVIRCPCSQYNEEGTMIQCEQCQVWQHCDCVNASADSEDNYFCERCGNREVNLDIVLVPQPDYAGKGETYYTSLKREDLQVCVGDTVYVLRAFKEQQQQQQPKQKPQPKQEDSEKMNEFQQGGILHKMMSPLKGPSQEASTLTKGNYPTYKTVGKDNASTSDMDIFRIERLWVDEKGDRFAFGHHYLRPHETFHEPSRKFFRNEVFRVPIYEVLPLDTIWGRCWVMDIPTFIKGRPTGAVEEHVYICEYRVDKTARLFNKISKPKHVICTKWYAFDSFDQKLKPQRTYTPHEIPEKWRSSSTPRSRSLEDDCRSNSNNQKQQQSEASSSANRRISSIAKINNCNSSKVTKKKDREKQKTKLEATLLKLLSKLPTKNSVDASYLLEPSSTSAAVTNTDSKRLRKKTNVVVPT